MNKVFIGLALLILAVVIMIFYMGCSNHKVNKKDIASPTIYPDPPKFPDKNN